MNDELNLDRAWIDKHLDILFDKLPLPTITNRNDFYFEPSNEIYQKLESGEDEDLQYVTEQIAIYLGLPNVPLAYYDLGIKMELDVAGQISGHDGFLQIRIPLNYVGKKYSTGAILSHEMTHDYMFSKGFYFDDVQENEKMTDLTSLCIGLGKFVLNGLFVDDGQYVIEKTSIGYVPRDLMFYAFNKINHIRGCNLDTLKHNLLPEVVLKFKE